MSRKVIAFANIAMWSTVFFFLVMFIVFAYIQPELNPLYRFGSEYSAGRVGWLMKLNFFVWGIGLVAFSLALTYGLEPDAKSPAAIVLFVIAGAGIFLSGIFDADLQVLNENPPPKWVEAPPSEHHVMHIIVGLVAFISLIPAIGLVSRQLRVTRRLSGKYTLLRPLSWLIPVTFASSLFILSPIGLQGLGQRMTLGCIFAWIILASRGLLKGAFRQAR